MDDETETDAVVTKGRLFDNMQTIEEYTTESIAMKAGVPVDDAEEYLEELAADGRIRKRSRDNTVKWIRFG